MSIRTGMIVACSTVFASLITLALEAKAEPSIGGLVFTAQEVGSDVVLTGTGSITTATLTGSSSFAANYLPRMSADFVSSGTGNPNPVSGARWSNIITSGSTNTWTNAFYNASSTSGDLLIFGMNFLGNGGDLTFPSTYVSGSLIFTTMTFSNKTLSSFGWVGVNNVWTLNNGETVSLVAASSPVPEIDPAGMGSVLALVTGALGLTERRRLKVSERRR